MAKTKDEFIQRLVVSMTITASAGTHNEYPFTDAYKPEDTIGFVIHRIEYAFENCYQTQLDTAADRVKVGLSFLKTFPTGGFEANDPGVLDHRSVALSFLGATSVEHYFEFSPWVTDWSNLPMGGILVHPVNLYAWYYTMSLLANDIKAHVTIFYTRIDLTPALHSELWQSIYIRQT